LVGPDLNFAPPELAAPFLRPVVQFWFEHGGSIGVLEVPGIAPRLIAKARLDGDVLHVSVRNVGRLPERDVKLNLMQPESDLIVATGLVMRDVGVLGPGQSAEVRLRLTPWGERLPTLMVSGDNFAMARDL
jgi:hypothetical protein